MSACFQEFARVDQATGLNPKSFPMPPLQMIFLNYQHVQIQRNGLYQCHSSPEYELILTTSSEYCCFIDRQYVKVKKGEFLLIQPFQMHQDILREGVQYDCFHFFLRSNIDNQEFHQLFNPGIRPQQQVAPIEAKTAGISRILWDELEKSGMTSSVYPLANALFQGILELCLRCYPPGTLNSNLSRDLKTRAIGIRLLHIFEKNLYGSLSLNDLCTAMSMSRSSLNRYCRMMFRLGPVQSFMLFKLQRAKVLLEQDPALSVKELSEKMGFANQFHFSRMFRRFHHIAPSKIHQQGEEHS